LGDQHAGASKAKTGAGIEQTDRDAAMALARRESYCHYAARHEDAGA